MGRATTGVSRNRTQWRPDAGIRSALGASRARLVRFLLAESVVLVAAGAAAATLSAAWGLPAAISMLAPGAPRLAEVAITLPVLAFTMAVSVLSVLLAGFLPALRAARAPSVAAMLGTRPESTRRHRA
jgi:ABC-type antimicrobial peptide transport system permease subunit